MTNHKITTISARCDDHDRIDITICGNLRGLKVLLAALLANVCEESENPVRTLAVITRAALEYMTEEE